MTCRIADVVENNLCTGCGGCAGLFPLSVEMKEHPVHGRRPVEKTENAIKADMICGATGMDYRVLGGTSLFDAEWGPVTGVWNGHAADAQIRFKGSSGGAISALSLYLLENGDVDGVLHTGQDPDNARLNATRLSLSRDDLLKAAGSRYAQSSPLDMINMLENTRLKAAFIGKPCDVATLAKSRRIEPKLADRFPVTISLFCAGPSNGVGVSKLLDRLGVPAHADLTNLRYRGEGWPGMMKATYLDDEGTVQGSDQITYQQGWGEVLQANRLWPCRICADHTGAFADISVGDPWQNPPKGNTDQGRSLIVARTPRARALIEDAIAKGYLVAEETTKDTIAAAQPNLAKARASAWGRRMTMRLMGMPVPQERGARMFTGWLLRLTLKEKVQSFVGTYLRLRRRKATPRPDVLGAALRQGK